MGAGVLVVVLLLVALLWTLAYRGAGTTTWIAAAGTLAATLVLALDAPAYVDTLLIGAATVFGAVLGIAGLRRTFVSAPLLRQFRKVMPPMSRTEREALEAGSVWWDAQLFSGRPDWESLLRVPRPRLSTEKRLFSMVLSRSCVGPSTIGVSATKTEICPRRSGTLSGVTAFLG